MRACVYKVLCLYKFGVLWVFRACLHVNVCVCVCVTMCVCMHVCVCECVCVCMCASVCACLCHNVHEYVGTHVTCAVSALKSVLYMCLYLFATGASQCDCHKPGKHRDRFSMACVMFFCTFRDLMSLSPISRRGSHDRCSSPSRRLISFCMKKSQSKN